MTLQERGMVRFYAYFNRNPGALIRLLSLYIAGEVLACVYFGGGTPNILKPAEYGTLMGWMRDRFRLAPGAGVTLEGVPQLFGEERMAAMAEARVTRVSIGAQQLKDELLQYSGRQQTADQVLEGIERGHRLGMVVNVDLICGWFDQTETDLEDDLRMLLPLEPESLVVHPLTLAGPSHFAQQKAKLPTPQQTCNTFMRGRKYLEADGYWGSSYADDMRANQGQGPRDVQYLRYCREILRYDRLPLCFPFQTPSDSLVFEASNTCIKNVDIPAHELVDIRRTCVVNFKSGRRSARMLDPVCARKRLAGSDTTKWSSRFVAG